MLERWDFEGSIDVRETFYGEADDEANELERDAA